MIVLATDARLDSRQLTRLAGRAFAGMARTGSDFSGHSGDYALAFSTADSSGAERANGGGASDGPVPDKDLDLLFLAAIEATEEAILNSLFMAVTTTGVGGQTRHAVPLDYVAARASAADQHPGVGLDPEHAVRPERHAPATAAAKAAGSGSACAVHVLAT